MIRKVTNENVNEVMEMCFKKFKKMESCNVPDDPDKGHYSLTPRIFGTSAYEHFNDPRNKEYNPADDDDRFWDCNVMRYKAVPFCMEVVPYMLQIFSYPRDIRIFKKGAFAWFRYKYGDTTPEWLKKERKESGLIV